MIDDNFHIADEDLLSLADGELPERRAAQIGAHLEACWTCRARKAEIERTISEFVRLTRETLEPELPPVHIARANLRMRLAELAESSRPDPWGRLRSVLNSRGLSYAFTLSLLLVVGTSWLLHRRMTNRKYHTQWIALSATLPNPILTPGATQPVSLGRLCSSEHDEVIRRVPDSLRQRVFREYGIADAPAADYEVDHLVTPGLGGSDDIRNLWPEPRYGTAWNSYVKDQLEDHLHHLVCAGQLNVMTAQHDIESDWISAYRKYFQTDAPLLPYSTPGAALSKSGDDLADETPLQQPRERRPKNGF